MTTLANEARLLLVHFLHFTEATLPNPAQSWNMGLIYPFGEDPLVQGHQNCVLGLQLSVKLAFHQAMGTWQQRAEIINCLPHNQEQIY